MKMMRFKLQLTKLDESKGRTTILHICEEALTAKGYDVIIPTNEEGYLIIELKENVPFPPPKGKVSWRYIRRKE